MLLKLKTKKEITENKIEELDKKLEELPNVRDNLVLRYSLEKEEQLKANANKDNIKERKTENNSLFKKLDFNLSKQNYAGKNGSSIHLNIVQEQTTFFQRKR